MRLVYPCLSIDWRAFDGDIPVLQCNIPAQLYPPETSSFLGSFEACDTKNSVALSLKK